jgi:hypothetical protein
MIAFDKAAIAAVLLAAVAGVSRVAAADVDDGSRAVVHARTHAAKPTTTTQFVEFPIYMPGCVLCHDGTPR